ncbi:MAG: hypothetical protein IPL46_29110 [Saprospiraceae bacterium]|nr:hypothetical protein [Saprospiraceae bacterium]
MKNVDDDLLIPFFSVDTNNIINHNFYVNYQYGGNYKGNKIRKIDAETSPTFDILTRRRHIAWLTDRKGNMVSKKNAIDFQDDFKTLVGISQFNQYGAQGYVFGQVFNIVASEPVDEKIRIRLNEIEGDLMNLIVQRQSEGILYYFPMVKLIVNEF